MPLLKNSTNLKNRISKLLLSKNKPLLPLFEIISNSIHAIQEKKKISNSEYKGKIKINIIRNGREEVLASLKDVEQYPINSFEIFDNGFGFDINNVNSFAELDTDKKAEIGGKGIGRLVCLKAVQKIIVESDYFEDGKIFKRTFEYKKSKDGFDNYLEKLPTKTKDTSSKVILYKYENEYAKNLPISMMEIAREIVTHFQLYFIQKIEPEIIIRNQDNTEINLRNLFDREFEKDILDTIFTVKEQDFNLYISKSLKGKSHKLIYCAHERSVRDEGLVKLIEDFRHAIINEDGSTYYFNVFIVSDFLNNNVNEERTGFVFSNEDDFDELDFQELSLSKIRKEAAINIEKLLKGTLQDIRDKKMESYLPVVEEEYPNYLSVINYNREKVEKLPSGLSKEQLDVKLYEIENEWRVEVKKEGIDLLDKKKDITSLEEYKKLYEKYLTDFNLIGQNDLARYVVHRKSVIDLLNKLIHLNDLGKFANEDIVHSLFFPIRETGQTVLHDHQNLWLIDERLTFNSLLASDKFFKKIDGLKSDSNDRMDLFIKKEEVFETISVYAEDKNPFESFTIIEFKKPERDNYVQGDKEKDPIKQVRSYIEEIINKKVKHNGKSLGASKSTPFYCYVIADITDSLEYILKYERFTKTADGLGYFTFIETDEYKAYFEVIPFKKVIKDSNQRNRVLFEKMKIG